MSRFNTVSPGTKITNLAGGQAYSTTPELELVSLLLTSFAQDEFYRGANQSFTRLAELISKCDKKFAAQAAIYARTKFGMRSITHVAASELARHVAGTEWGKVFYDKIVYRPDDMMEILSYHSSKKQKITNAMRTGFGNALGRFDKYALAKYRGEGKEYSLVDIVNLCHPKRTEKSGDAIQALINGDLKSFDTWETELSKAGQTASNEEELKDLKKEAWTKLILEKKVGYFALLRNLRNIIEQAPEVLDQALELLVEERLIKKSLVLPFRFLTAFEEV